MYQLKYGNAELNVDIAKRNVAGVLRSNPVERSEQTTSELIQEALDHPIGAPMLEEVVKPGERVCVIVSDITRIWQSQSSFLPVLVNRLNALGVPDENILMLSALGTHRKQTPEEHKEILGENLYKRVKIVDHECYDKSKLTYYGETSRHTPVYFNSLLKEYDRIILTGAIVYHFMAGFGGGRKSILPGVAGLETINKNHNLGLLPERGAGSNPLVSCGHLAENPFHLDLIEAVSMVHPDYLLNVVVDGEHNVIKAFAGDWQKAHEAGAKFVEKMNGIRIDRQASLVIASAEGFPKDINLYQTSKTLTNALAAMKKGGTLIILSSCREGFGNKDTRHILCDFKTLEESESALREHFTIGGFIGFSFKECAKKNHLILLSDMKPDQLKGTGIHVVSSMDEALLKAAELNGGSLDMDTLIMPQGGTTFPVLA